MENINHGRWKALSAKFECYWGAYCSHAILTDKLGVYHCPFGGICFKRGETSAK